MSLSNIRSALVQGVQAALPTTTVAWENKAFTKPATVWASFFLIPSTTEPSTLGAAGLDEHLGIAQVDLNVPLNTGEQAVLALAELVARYFYAGRRLTYDSTEVHVYGVGRNAGRLVDGWFRVSMTITWRAWLARNR